MVAATDVPILSAPKVIPRAARDDRVVVTLVRSQRRGTGSWVLVAVVVGVMALGVLRFLALRAPIVDASTIRVGAVSYRVTGAEQVRGLTDADLSGMAHGIQGLVTAEKALVTVSVVVSAGDAPATYDPSQLQVAARGSDASVSAVGATIPGGALDAHASLEGAVSFVVPRDGSHLVLRAPGQSQGVDLLQVDVTAPSGGDHVHSAASAVEAPASSSSVTR